MTIIKDMGVGGRNSVPLTQNWNRNLQDTLSVDSNSLCPSSPLPSIQIGIHTALTSSLEVIKVLVPGKGRVVTVLVHCCDSILKEW